MPNLNDLKTSKFLTKNDVEPDVLVTIKSYEEMNVAMENQAPDLKWCLWFKELDKPMVLNVTNGQLLGAITGSGEFDDWIGKQVVLYNDKTVMFAGEFTGGIRIKAKKGGEANPELDNEPHPDITNPDNQTETGFCPKCGKPLSAHCACDDIPF